MAKLNPTLDEMYGGLNFVDGIILQYHKLCLDQYISGAQKPNRVIIIELSEMLDNYITEPEYKQSVKKLKKAGLYDQH